MCVEFRVHLLLAIVDIGNHQHHELHGSSPPFVCLSCTLGRVAAPEFDTHPNYVCSRRRSALVVPVVAAPPDGRLVAPLGRAVEPLGHAPEAVQSARIGGIGMVDDAVLECERSHALSRPALLRPLRGVAVRESSIRSRPKCSSAPSDGIACYTGHMITGLLIAEIAALVGEP